MVLVEELVVLAEELVVLAEGLVVLVQELVVLVEGLVVLYSHILLQRIIRKPAFSFFKYCSITGLLIMLY